MQHAWREIMPTVSWLVKLKERSHLEELVGKIILKGILKHGEGRTRTGLIMLIVVANGYFSM